MSSCSWTRPYESWAFDIETNGLFPHVSVIQCINMISLETGEERRYTDREFYNDPWTGETDTSHEGVSPRYGDIDDGIQVLENCDLAVAHNGIGYDFPVLEFVRGANFEGVTKRCTQVMASLIWPDIKGRDMARHQTAYRTVPNALPGEFFKQRLAGTHKLAAWGFRLGEPKDSFNPSDYNQTWATMPWCKVEDDYCMQDVRTLVKLYELCVSKEYSEESIQLEHDVKHILNRQEQHGWLFDKKYAEQLVGKLQIRKVELNEECTTLYAPFYLPDGTRDFTPKRDNKKMGYVKGAASRKIKLVDFNSGSRHHIANRLQQVEGWVPTEFTPKGQPEVSEKILSALPYPSAKKLVEYLTIEKRLGMLAEGREGWLRNVKSDGRIHGRVNGNGAVTGRMSHFHPNVAQADKDPSMRACWIVPDDKVLVGCDADGLELRMMGHFLHPFDKGAFIKVILEGNSNDGTDLHSRNMNSLRFESRDNAKTFFYAMIYGAGNFKLGTIVIDDFTEAKRDKFYARFAAGDSRGRATARLGGGRRRALVDGILGMTSLIDRLKKAAGRGWIKGLDGRRVSVRSLHSVLNTLFQSAGAVVMKKALVLCDEAIQSGSRTKPGVDYEFVGNIHDEFQIESDKEIGNVIGTIAAESIAKAGRHFNLRCPLAGNFKTGRNWSETH